MIDENLQLEAALSRTEDDVERALKAAQALVTQLRRVHRAAVQGSTRDLEKALGQASQLAGSTRDAVATAKSGWQFATRDYLESGEFTREVLAIADQRGLVAQEQDGRIVSFPSLVRVLSNDEAVEIDRKKSRDLRPSRIVERLQQAQTSPPRFRPEHFLKTLLGAYKFVVKPREVGEVVRLIDIYDVLTLLPGQRMQYSKPEFARDIYLLDESRVDVIDGLHLSFHAATGAKTARALRAVTRDGDVKTYYGIAFRP